MADHGYPRTRSLLDSVADDTERLQAAIATRTVAASSADGRVTVEVSADGKVHNWRITDADEHTNRIVANVLQLIGQAHTAAKQAIRTELDAIADREDVRAVHDAARDALALTTTTPSPALTAGDDSWDDDFDHFGNRSRIAAD
ncbi:YbaB/EbfC family nucleoid-associated protein [Nocardia sp. NPDC020380]|uniref:YbaB/EbfC family nucleoid-associated protein n=1 Tax=Nocardia sp. NPDC020380 TaxID=3364309 RepID=UPI0037B4E13A